MSQLFDMRPERPGYRLQRLEIYNWGTFDSTAGQIYRFEPQGRTSLLVGHNGSGKSTLVDAITTLLVDSRSRKYNNAAGAKSKERTTKSYIKGAFDRTADESQASVVRFLRPKAKHLSAISGVFRDEQLGKAFTLTQVLYLKSDGSDDKVYAIADKAHELQTDLDGLTKSDEVREHLKQAGYQTTKTYVEYHGWLSKRTGMRGKAVDMFNQTIAVKDIGSLNDFIRKHMLESSNWREKIQRLLTHFADLSTAHQELVRAKHQIELLVPIEKQGSKYRRKHAELEQLEQQIAAAGTFFPVQIVKLFEPEIERQQECVADMTASIARLDEELRDKQETTRKLLNEIDQAGGERLKTLPGLIGLAQDRLASRKVSFSRFHDLLRACGIKGTVKTAGLLEQAQGHLQTASQQAQAKAEKQQAEYETAIGKRAAVESSIREEREELAMLESRRSNLPPRFTEMRRQICNDLNLDQASLPFAAELISVLPEENRWEASAEMVLRPLALSLLVPENHYRRVRSYVETNRICDQHGQGSRIDYIRVGQATTNDSGDRIQANSLYHKLRFKSQHPLTPWVRGEIMRRFDFHCCESVESFNEVSRMALTANRHVKYNAQLHKKDDRKQTVDPRHFVLGWDNTEKKKRIAQHVETLEQESGQLSASIADSNKELDRLRGIIHSAHQAMEVTDFDAIDVNRHQTEIATLQEEKKELEESNDQVKTLRKALAAARAEEGELKGQRDEQIGSRATLESEIKRVTGVVRSAKAEIDQARAESIYDLHAKQFDAIEQALGELPLTVTDFDARRRQWEQVTRRQADKLREPLKKLGEGLVGRMAKFLTEFKEEQDDLDASLDALDSFLGLLAQLQGEDLPRHEKKFKDRLNDQVTQEIAVFRSSLEKERRGIASKIEQLNEALASVEYDRIAGTLMRLEPKLVQDREIKEFRQSLKDCMDDSFEQSDEANEQRFLRIKRLVERLGNKEKSLWRNKVIDVRNWYDFAAMEIDRESGNTLSCYDGSSGQSGGEKAKLAFTILVAALSYQFDIDPTGTTPGRFQFVVVDEMFSKVDDQNAAYALELFKQFGLQLLIVAPLDAKARITEPFVDRYLHVVKDAQTNRSQLYSMTAREYDEVVSSFASNGKSKAKRRKAAK